MMTMQTGGTVNFADDPQFQAWAQSVQANVLPKLNESALSLLAVAEDDVTSIDFAVQLGMSIMLDKPIIAVVQPGMKVPSKLVQVADRIVEMDAQGGGSPEQIAKLKEAIEAAMRDIDTETPA